MQNTVTKDLKNLIDDLKQQRDEIELKLHLATMDAKEEWHKSDEKWQQIVDNLGVITDESKETSAEIIHATKIIGDELSTAYQLILKRLHE